jgi:hypothetical protein
VKVCDGWSSEVCIGHPRTDSEGVLKSADRAKFRHARQGDDGPWLSVARIDLDHEVGSSGQQLRVRRGSERGKRGLQRLGGRNGHACTLLVVFTKWKTLSELFTVCSISRNPGQTVPMKPRSSIYALFVSGDEGQAGSVRKLLLTSLVGLVSLVGCSSPAQQEGATAVATFVDTTVESPVDSTLASTTIGTTAPATDVVTLPETTASSPTTSSSTVPAAFVPPSTTLPDDPDLREAIRVRVAVEAEYRRQAREGLADPAGFDGLADPQTWLPFALKDLESRQRERIVTSAVSISGAVVSAARYQSSDEIVLETCVFDDDLEVATKGTTDSSDDTVTDGLDVEKYSSLMKRKNGKWLYQGSVTLSSSC